MPSEQALFKPGPGGIPSQNGQGTRNVVHGGLKVAVFVRFLPESERFACDTPVGSNSIELPIA